jgi:hypothetical protein
MQTPTTMQLGKDAIVAVALAITLAGVYVVDRAVSSVEGDSEEVGDRKTDGVTIGEAQEKEIPIGAETKTEPKPLRLAVTPANFDDMGSLLDRLGEGYRHVDISMEDLLDCEKLRQYDVVFVPCSGMIPESWLGERVGEGARNASVFSMKEEIERQLKESVRAYVRQGGILYASDWQFTIVQMTFEDALDRSQEHALGKEQYVEAELVDSGLAETLGSSSIKLHFDKDGWHPASFAGSNVTTYMRGSYETMDGKQMTKPLLVRIRDGEGEVFFTAFHNEVQNSEEEKRLLEYLIFTMVTSKVESKVRETMVQGGFSPQKQSLLSTSAGQPSVTKTYRCDKAGPLRFVLAFEDRGALLQLQVEGPDGRKFEKEGTSTVQIDVPDAKVGDWLYTITAKRVPFANFPFTFTVGQK